MPAIVVATGRLMAQRNSSSAITTPFFTASAVPPIGFIPTTGAIDTDGLDVSDEDMDKLLALDVEGWRAEVPGIREHYARFGDKLPAKLNAEVDRLEQQLG